MIIYMKTFLNYLLLQNIFEKKIFCNNLEFYMQFVIQNKVMYMRGNKTKTNFKNPENMYASKLQL